MRLYFAFAALFLSGCAFVTLSEGGAGVAQLGAGDVANCNELSVITTSTRAKVVINRSKADVQEELTTLARNEAAILGANAIVPIGSPEEGRQRFRAYQCN